MNEVRDTHRSCSPGSRKLFIISFLRDTGRINSGCLLIWSISLSAYLLILKKYASSFAGFTSRPQSGHLPSFSCDSVQKDSQGVQYIPS